MRGVLKMVVAVLVLGGVACSEAPAPRECLAGEPRAFFSEADAGVYFHEFKAAGQSSFESVGFTNSEPLNIQQIGCDTLVQTFEVDVDNSVDTWSALKAVVEQRFTAYSQIDRRLLPLQQYARVMQAVPDDFPVGAPANLAPGLTLRFFKVPTPENTRWQIRFEQDLTQVQGGQ